MEISTCLFLFFLILLRIYWFMFVYYLWFVSFRLFLENCIYFNLCPYKMAFSLIFWRYPPVSSFQQTLDHCRIVSRPNVIFDSSRFIIKLLKFKIQVYVNIVAYLQLKKQISITFYSFIVNVICFLSSWVFNTC